jgi:hypothetical protein
MPTSDRRMTAVGLLTDKVTRTLTVTPAAVIATFAE